MPLFKYKAHKTFKIHNFIIDRWETETKEKSGWKFCSDVSELKLSLCRERFSLDSYQKINNGTFFIMGLMMGIGFLLGKIL